MIPSVRWLVMLSACTYGSGLAITAEPVSLDRDGAIITRDTKIKPRTYSIADPGGDGAVRIACDGITVDFQGAELVGATAAQLPDSYLGKGIVIHGKKVTLRNAKVGGYKVGIYAKQCPGLVIEDVDVSGNYRQRLLSTPEAEDASDWLLPHHNGVTKWMDEFGAGLCIERSDHVTIRRLRARNGQNGIILDRVNESKVYDNDCSFLSGWGLAMWRSNHNVISRNAFDFCVRGYSHGVYNRGQDSAGILMFEQNNDNVVAENSATHGGDGFFGFAGEDALAKAERVGNNRNLLIGNDFSYAAAHGIEMTFSFDNQFINNRLVGNAICGIWGGYSQDTLIAGNQFEGNGESGYGPERGGVNIEHGSGNRIVDNIFKDNACGVRLWCDEDAALMENPWVKANHKGSVNNTVARNAFSGDAVALELLDSRDTLFVENRIVDAAKGLKIDEKSNLITTGKAPQKIEPPKYPAYGETRPVGVRKHLYGRAYIIVTAWGPIQGSR